jgi:hypothetical protein
MNITLFSAFKHSLDDLVLKFYFPKFSFIEVCEESNELLKNSVGKELVIFWENEIPYKFFAEDKIFYSDADLINEFYKDISTN